MRRKSVKEKAVSLALTGMCILTLCSGCGQEDGVAQGSEEAPEPEACPHPDDWQEEAEDGSLPTEIPGGAYVSDEEPDSDAAEIEDTLPDDAEGKTDMVVEKGKLSPVSEEGQPGKKELDIPEDGRRLTEEELEEYTEWIQDISNYGFLLSDWEDPAQINLYQVFYNGAGVAREGTEEEKRAYMERNDQPEIYTDFIAMDQAEVDAVLLEKVGLTYEQLVEKGSRGMEDAYYTETDSFCLERGDTNYIPFACTGGVAEESDGIVTLYCEGDDWVRLCEVKVETTSGHRRFLSNHIVEGSILDADWYFEMISE